jgi:hypothetical protein
MRVRLKHARNVLLPLDGLLNAPEGRICVPGLVNHQKRDRTSTMLPGESRDSPAHEDA